VLAGACRLSTAAQRQRKRSQQWPGQFLYDLTSYWNSLVRRVRVSFLFKN
jgi:hypothetical protein